MTSPTIDHSNLEHLRYPAGRNVKPTHVTSQDRARWIEEIAGFPARMRAAAERLTDVELDTPYRPGGWTKRQVVHHVVDSHMNAYIRFQLGLTEHEPTVKPYDEKAWAEFPYARTAPIAGSLTLLEILHDRWVATLRTIKDDQWSRAVMHPENGRMTLDDILKMYEWHCRHHLGHVELNSA